MYSTKKFAPARLCLAFLITFNKVNGLAATTDLNKISITDFKYYRKIYYNNQQLLLYKDPSIKSVHYLSDKHELDFTKNMNKVSMNFKFDSKTINYKISITNNKMNFSWKNKTVYFNNADYSICEKTLSEKAISIDLRPYTKGIKASIISSLTDETCNEKQKEMVGLSFQNMLDNEKSWLSKCYSNNSVNKLIKSDPKYLSYSLSVYSKYLNLVKKLGEGGKPIQVSCRIDTPNKLGSFDETKTPAKISLDWKNLETQTENGSQLPENIKSTLAHELFHYGEPMQSLENEKYETCINESYAKLFTDVCLTTENERNLENLKDRDAGKIKNQKIHTSAELDIACKNNTKLSSLKSKDKTRKMEDGIDNGKVGVISSYSYKSQQQQQQNAAIQTDLASGANPVKQSDFTQPSDSDFATLASNTTAGTTEGNAYTVSANSTFGQTVQKTMNSFANSGNTLTTKLNSALATTTSTAQANTTTLATTGSNSTTSTQTGSNYIPTSTSTSTTTPANDVSNTNTRMPANIEDNSGNYSGTSGKTSLGNSGQPSAMGGGTPSSGGSNNSFSTGKGNLGNTNAGKGEMAQAANSYNRGSNAGGFSSAGGASTSASSVNQKMADQKQTEGTEIVKTIQSLKAFNTVTGGQYQEIKKYYNNSQFQNLLQTYDMRIMIKNATGQYVAIGVDNKKAKKVFNDDGQVLKTVEEKK